MLGGARAKLTEQDKYLALRRSVATGVLRVYDALAPVFRAHSRQPRSEKDWAGMRADLKALAKIAQNTRGVLPALVPALRAVFVEGWEELTYYRTGVGRVETICRAVYDMERWDDEGGGGDRAAGAKSASASRRGGVSRRRGRRSGADAPYRRIPRYEGTRAFRAKNWRRKSTGSKNFRGCNVPKQAKKESPARAEPAGLEILEKIAASVSMEEEDYFERLALQVVKMLLDEYILAVWKLTAWKLRTMHGWGYDRISAYLRKRKMEASREKVIKAVEEVAASCFKAKKILVGADDDWLRQ